MVTQAEECLDRRIIDEWVAIAWRRLQHLRISATSSLLCGRLSFNFIVSLLQIKELMHTPNSNGSTRRSSDVLIHPLYYVCLLSTRFMTLLHYVATSLEVLHRTRFRDTKALLSACHASEIQSSLRIWNKVSLPHIDRDDASQLQA